MSTSAYRVERARVASLSRSRTADDPELVASRHRMAEERLVKEIDQALSKAPPITDQLRERLSALVRQPPVEMNSQSQGAQ